MNLVTATHYNGSLYVGYGKENEVAMRLGDSIEVYRNPISKLFARLRGLSTEAIIGGKQRCVNTESFKKHLKSINLEIIDFNGKEPIKYLIKYDNIIAHAHNTLPSNNKLITDGFSSKKRLQLLKKAAYAKHDLAIKKHIRKGAFNEKFIKSNALARLYLGLFQANQEAIQSG